MEETLFDMRTNIPTISSLPNEPVLTMAYVLYQNPTVIYSAEYGLKQGTIFPCLEKPFYGCEVTKK